MKQRQVVMTVRYYQHDDRQEVPHLNVERMLFCVRIVFSNHTNRWLE